MASRFTMVGSQLALAGGHDLFRDDEGGYTTVTVAVSLLLVIALLFSAAQVQWVQSASPDIQFVADAGALAAENVVAQYYTISRVADAVVLSMSLLCLALMGIGTVLCCIPPTIPVGLKVVDAARSVKNLRDRFADSVRKALDAVQKFIPVLGAINATLTIAANSHGASYVGTAVVLPLEGSAVSFSNSDDEEQAIESMESSNEQAAQSANESSESQREADDAKYRAYMADCGSYPRYCMFQRARTLAGLDDYQNPFFSSVDTWSFDVPLQRARAYYRARLANERPLTGSLESEVDSNCRRAFYGYAVELMKTGYVNQAADGSLQAYFPLLPTNTDEMRQTSLYTQRIWPVSEDGCIHGASSCPGCAEGIVRYASLADLESGSCSECDQCRFRASSLGATGSPSSHIDNGFEYHYRIVAREAQRYAESIQQSHQAQQQTQQAAESSFETFEDALKKVTGADKRYNPTPPGRYGCIAVVVDLQEHEAPRQLQTPLLASSSRMGPRLAVSAAALAQDQAGEQGNIVSSMLSGIRQDVEDAGGGFLEAALDWVMELWGAALQFYSDGIDALVTGIRNIIDSIPIIGQTGLGEWASNALLEGLEALGLQPPELSSPKPAVLNTVHVLEQDNQTLSSALRVVRGALGISDMPQSITIEGLSDDPITITLPQSAEEVPQAVLQTLVQQLERAA